MSLDWKNSIPRAVQNQADIANRRIEQINSDRELYPPRGKPPLRQPYKKPVIILGSTSDEVDRRLKNLEAILGKRICGNVRWGRVAQYAELMEKFERLQAAGITLPGNSSLSAKACKHRLGNWLRRYNYTRFSDNGLVRSSAERRKICRTKCGSAFQQVRQVLENSPPKIA